MKARTEVAKEDCWHVDAMFEHVHDWEHAFKQFNMDAIASFKGRLGEGPAVLKEALETLFALARQVEKLYTYAHLRHDEDLANGEHKAAYQKVMMQYSSFQEQTAWIEPELLSLPKETLDEYLASEALRPYRFYLEKIVRLQPHTLDEKGERLLAMAGQPLQAASRAFSALNNADLKFGKIKDEKGETHELTHGSYQLFLRSSDRTLRKNAFMALHRHYEGVENTLGELLYGQVQQHAFNAKARGYGSSLSAALFPKNIPPAVYKNLIHTVKEHLPTLHRYVGLRKKALKLDEIRLYDMYVPLVEDEKGTIPYSDAESLVIESVSPLGKEYQAALKQGMTEQGWVDRYENENKRSGAYSSGCFDSNPYILMNYKGILRDVFTLAHEAGHSMHSYLSHKTQPYHDSHYPIFVAEVASTFNEELLMHLLLNQKISKKQELFLVNEKIEDIRATLFRQTMFAEFELKIHELVESGTPLTPQLLKELYLELNADYFGPELTIDPIGAIEWARIPHFYYNFYVYQYATGISAALALSEKVLDGDEQARQNYLTFLNGGGHLFPVDLLKLAGIDITTSAPIEAALTKFETLVTKLEKILT